MMWRHTLQIIGTASLPDWTPGVGKGYLKVFLGRELLHKVKPLEMVEKFAKALSTS
ncbi:MAG: hypothetical protein HQL70_02885 [Magnetococcales bacterium]|nr:hypothetical protein [Magnetococcales bacterium]